MCHTILEHIPAVFFDSHDLGVTHHSPFILEELNKVNYSGALVVACS